MGLFLLSAHLHNIPRTASSLHYEALSLVGIITENRQLVYCLEYGSTMTIDFLESNHQCIQGCGTNCTMLYSAGCGVQKRTEGDTKNSKQSTPMLVEQSPLTPNTFVPDSYGVTQQAYFSLFFFSFCFPLSDKNISLSDLSPKKKNLIRHGDLHTFALDMLFWPVQQLSNLSGL